MRRLQASTTRSTLDWTTVRRDRYSSGNNRWFWRATARAAQPIPSAETAAAAWPSRPHRTRCDASFPTPNRKASTRRSQSLSTRNLRISGFGIHGFDITEVNHVAATVDGLAKLGVVGEKFSLACDGARVG